MSELTDFLTEGYAAAVEMMGTPCRIIRAARGAARQMWSGQGIVCTTGGSYNAELGGSVVEVDAQAQLPASALVEVGDTLEAGGKKYLVVALHSSPFDPSLNLSLTTR